jgi:hypothetical protein
MVAAIRAPLPTMLARKRRAVLIWPLLIRA